MSVIKVVRAVAEAVPQSKRLESEDYEGFSDPHVWFDVTLWMYVVDAISEALSEADPENAAYYAKNAKAYKQELEKTQQKVLARINEVPSEQRVLITAHDAFRYFGKAYDFKVKGLQGISTASEAGTKDVQNLVAYIVKNKIPAIFVESSIPVRTIEAVQAACKAQGWDVSIGGELFADAMGDEGTPEGTYIGMVDHNVETIVSALLRESSHDATH
jgi:manganese/zinc/iron transport system substrate-binding protein